jgi:hypothetical protein
LGVPPLGRDDRRRKIAIDNVNDGQVTVALKRKASAADESDFRSSRQIMRKEHMKHHKPLRIALFLL